MIAGCADLRAQSLGLQRSIFQVKVLRDDAGVPGAAGGGDQAGHQVRKNSRQNHNLPPLPSGESEEPGDLLQVGRNRR